MTDHAASSSTDFGAHMRRGETLHLNGRPEEALTQFESALALRPDDVQAASACASMLVELQRPQAAWALLLARRDALLADADGACNLAILAESCGQPGQARAAYDRALELDNAHLRALNNRGLLAGREGRWLEAVADLQKAVAVLPQEMALRVNLTDMLTGARDYPRALQQTAQADHPALRLRRAVLLAFMGDFKASNDALLSLDESSRALLASYLGGAPGTGGGKRIPGGASALPDAYDLFLTRSFDALQDCEWQGVPALVEALREQLRQAAAGAEARDWRDAQFYALMLPLSESEQTQIRAVAARAISNVAAPGISAFVQRRCEAGQRLRIGLFTQSLADPRYRNALERQLSLHDRSRFAFFIYSPTPQPQAAQTDVLRRFADGVAEVGHLGHAEAAMRMRLDRLDLWVDTAFNTPWCRADLPALRVAPLQMRSQTWQRIHLATPCDYSFGDHFTHPQIDESHGAVIRLPASCWLAANDDLPSPAATRSQAGLHEDALVLAAFVPAIAIDADTFAVWMQLLRTLPQAVLWLPAYGPAARANLQRQVELAGIAPQRLVFLQRMSRPDLLAHMALADLFIDSLRFNANHGLADALRMGVPAVSCAGGNMASRLGGSIISAAGLPECVTQSPADYLEKITALCKEGELLALRQRLSVARASAPLFDTAARLRDWESAWAQMIERQREGRAPQAFDVAPA